jgi:phenylpropionate dioxygenase-like ring-hydroxylating dioxygenase large terminal subunit
MQHAAQVAMIRRLLERIEQGRPDMPGEPTEVPLDIYTSAERFEREKRLLHRVPVLLETTARLRRPGDFLTHDDLGIPLLLSVDRAGEVRGHLNVCRHRGARLVEEESGARRHVFACPYHGWAYGADGRVNRIPHAYGFEERQCERSALAPFPVAQRHGFVFTSPGPDIDGWLGGLGPELAGWHFQQQHHAYRIDFPLEGNWKTLMENSFETYHLHRVHAGTVAAWTYDNIALLDEFGPHQRMIVPKRSIEEHVRLPESQWNLLAVANVVYLVFPNTILLVREASLVQFTAYPCDAARGTVRVVSSWREPVGTDEDRLRAQRERESFVQSLGEDVRIVGSVQRGMHAGANRVFTFGRFEAGLARFHRALAAQLE